MVDIKVRKLINEAKSAREKAYAPYSKFKVGAALLAKSGKIYAGCNVENAIYNGTHAERFALDNAVIRGEREFLAIAIVLDDKSFPCAQCLQNLTEFDSDGKGNLKIITVNLQGNVRESTLAKLLPERFGPKSLGIDVRKF